MGRSAGRKRTAEARPPAPPPPSEGAQPRAERPRPWLPATVLVALTAAVYAPVRNADFVNYDDYHYVVENPHVSTGLTLKNVAWALPAFAAGNWHPLTWISHQLDCTVYGLNPGGHHVTNVVLHAASAALLLAVLHSMTGSLWRSAFVAALFALHPLNVESVAWISERKNVLSTLFWILTLGAYAAYVRRPRPARYGLVALTLALGLMSKPMVVTLPCVLLLLDVWPLQRWRWDQHDARDRGLALLREKLPLFGLVAISSLLTVAAQKGAGAMTTLDQVGLDARIENAVVSYLKYLSKTVWPSGLSVFYPHPGRSLPALGVALAALALAALTLAAWRARRAPYLLVGWLWYLGTLVPVIGVVQVGSQAMADRYAYVPLLGPFVAIVWGLGDAAGAALGRWLPGLGLAALAALALATRTQAGYWRDSIALFEHAKAVTKRNYVAYTNLGLAYNKQKRWEEAIANFERALRIMPTSAEALGHMGLALAKEGRIDEAIASLSKAIEAYPASVQGHNNLGVALRKRDPDKAIEHLRQAVALDPDFPEARVNLGAVFLEKGQVENARRCFDEALEIASGAAPTHFRVGSAWLERNSLEEAAAHFEAALRLDPRYADAHNSLGVARLRQRRLEAAVDEFHATLRLEPDHADAHSNLGTAFVRQGQAKQGIEELRTAIRLNPRHADAHATLGAALAQSGNLPEAVEHFTAAVDADPANIVAQNNLGAALLQKGDLAGARTHLLKALELSPGNADAHCNLGILLLQEGDVKGATEHLSAALEANPGLANAREYLKTARATKGRGARGG